MNLLIQWMLLVLVMANMQRSIESKNISNSQKDRSLSHLQYLISLKQEVASKYWNKFASKKLFSPVLYYTKRATYALAPNNHILGITEYTELEALDSGLPLIQLDNVYLDTLSFQFSSSYSTDSADLYFEDNVLSFQSLELTQKFIPDIVDIQDWSIMVIHELFHGYQRSIPAHKSYFSNLAIPNGPDNFLGKYYKDLDWFRKSIHDENDLLKGIWRDQKNLRKNLLQYDSIKTLRINKIKRTYGIDIREIEDYEIMIEGQARYFESLCKRYLSRNNQMNKLLKDSDSLLVTDMFQNYDVTNDKNLFNVYNHRYYYAIGFNISMILEIYAPDYKESIYFKHQNFNQYLKELEKYNYDH